MSFKHGLTPCRERDRLNICTTESARRVRQNRREGRVGILFKEEVPPKIDPHSFIWRAKLDFVREAPPDCRVKQLRMVCRGYHYGPIIERVQPLNDGIHHPLEFTELLSVITQFGDCIHLVEKQLGK
jgi:hypothetical protein